MCIKLLCSLLGKVSRLLLFLQAKILLSKGKEHVFFEHIVDPSWNYKPDKKQINPYFAKYGFRYSMVECVPCSAKKTLTRLCLKLQSGD